MDKNREKKISKSLSFWLRHNPEDIGITIGNDGWTDIDELIERAADKGVDFTFDELNEVVKNNDKKRFLINEDETLIRANQGHSIEIEMKFNEAVPPQILYHGTPVGVVGLIMKEGLSKMNRHHVHLSPDEKTASIVGSRRGEFEILEVEAMRMRADGYKIYMSENGVYLVDEVPAKYINRQRGFKIKTNGTR